MFRMLEILDHNGGCVSLCKLDERQYMKLRRPIVIRLHKFKQETQPHEFYFSELQLFHIFKHPGEEQLCREDENVCISVYEDNIEDINYVKARTMPYMKIVEVAQQQADELQSCS